MKPECSTSQKSTETSYSPETHDYWTCQWVTNGQVCMHESRTSTELDLHIRSVHAPQKKRIVCSWKDCTKYGTMFVDNRNFSEHLSLHTGRKAYICEVCHQEFNRRRELYAHRRLTHAVSHEEEAPTLGTSCLWANQFEHCSFNARDIAELAEHVRSFHHKDATDLVCRWETCYRHFSPLADARNLLAHMLRHTGYRPYKCQHCPETVVMEYLLTQHLESNHPETLNSNDQKHFYCYWEEYGEECHFAGATAVELTNHIISYHKPVLNEFACRWRNCSLQPGEIESKREFVSHFREKHNKKDRPYECPECPSKFCFKFRLNFHMKKSHPEATPQIRCYWMENFSLCTQICGNFTELREHVITMHTELQKNAEKVEKLVCRWDGCWREVQEDQDLTKHIITHTRNPGKKRAAQISDDHLEDDEINEEPVKRRQKKFKSAEALSVTAPTNFSSDQHQILPTNYQYTQQMPTSSSASQHFNYHKQYDEAQYWEYEEQEGSQQEAEEVIYDQNDANNGSVYTNLDNMPGPSNGAEMYPQDDIGFEYERL